MGASAAAFFVIINAINLTNVKVFGEMEFWFAIIKVIAVVAMIIFGGWLLFSGNGGPQASVSNLWNRGLPAAWLHRSGDDDGDYHVLFRWTGAGWDHRSRSG